MSVKDAHRREGGNAPSVSGGMISCSTGALSGRYTLSGTERTLLDSGSRPSRVGAVELLARFDGVGDRVD